MTDISVPEKAALMRKIINNILRDHFITMDELVGSNRTKEFCDARRDAAKRLSAAGFTPQRIGEVLKRERTSIVHCLSNKMLVRKRERHRVYKILHTLEPGIREIVSDIAAAEGVSPQAVIREWISERAHYEAEAKARAA